jgi:hypothetical protein
MNKSIAKLLRDEMYYRFKIQMWSHFEMQINGGLKPYIELDTQLYIKLMMQLDRQIWEANYE